MSGPGEQLVGNLVDQQRARRILAITRRRTRSSKCRPWCRNTSAPARKSPRRRRAAGRPTRCPAPPGSASNRRTKAASCGSDSSAVPRAPFQLACSSARKLSKACRAPSGVRSLTTSTAPSADSRFQSCRSFLRVEPDRFTPNSRVTKGRAVSESIRGSMPRLASSFGIAAIARTFRVERLQADDFRQRPGFSRSPRRTPQSPRRRRPDRPRGWKERRSCRAAPQAASARTARLARLQRPDDRPACDRPSPAPRPADTRILAKFSSRRPPSARRGS